MSCSHISYVFLFVLFLFLIDRTLPGTSQVTQPVAKSNTHLHAHRTHKNTHANSHQNYTSLGVFTVVHVLMFLFFSCFIVVLCLSYASYVFSCFLIFSYLSYAFVCFLMISENCPGIFPRGRRCEGARGGLS